jgi:hypothetical protein
MLGSKRKNWTNQHYIMEKTPEDVFTWSRMERENGIDEAWTK